MKILVAEDTVALNRAVAAMLKYSDYEVDAAYDGEMALNCLAHNAYDAVVLDVMMPKVDGLEVLREMRRQHNMTPVLMLTALSGIDDRVRGLEAGADDYLSKPFAMKELQARVNALCRRRNDYGADELKYADLSLNPNKLELKAVNTVRVSARECELLHLFLSNRDKDLDSQYLLSHVWNDDAKANPDTLRLYVSYLQNKLRFINSSVKVVGSDNTGYRLSASE